MQKLVVDVGLYDGEDSAYYLKCGYRVLGIDADPMVVARCTAKFEREIASGQVTLLNVGIAEREQTLTFYRNLSEEGQSSFFPEYGQRGGEFVSMEVRCIPLRQVLETYGIPYYLKVDIEGMDEVAISSLDRASAPEYLSAELSRSSKIIEHLHSIGYRHFKLINQAYHTTSTPVFPDEFGWRMLRKAGRAVPPLKKAIGLLPWRMRPKMEWDSPYVVDGEVLGANRTGPFGDKTHGRWIGPEQAAALLHRIGETESQESGALWWDVHAAKTLTNSSD